MKPYSLYSLAFWGNRPIITMHSAMAHDDVTATGAIAWESYGIYLPGNLETNGFSGSFYAFFR